MDGFYKKEFAFYKGILDWCKKKICTDIRFQSSLLDLHHITGLLNSKKMCKFCLNVAKNNVFWSVTKQCKRPPQLFETNYDIVYNILFVPFFPFLKHYASKNYFVALLKTKIGAHFIDINLRQKKKKKIIFLFSWIWIDVMIFFVCIVFLLTRAKRKMQK